MSERPESAAASASPPAIQWRLCRFEQLQPAELYSVLQLRQMVFVVEQNCPYLDADGYDSRAVHLLGRVDTSGEPLLGAYARIFGPGVKYEEASIGRIVTHPSVRRTGLGRLLLDEAIRQTTALAPGSPIRIGAQLYLERFYKGFGFRRASPPYDEDGIEHIEMLREPP